VDVEIRRQTPIEVVFDRVKYAQHTGAVFELGGVSIRGAEIAACWLETLGAALGNRTNLRVLFASGHMLVFSVDPHDGTAKRVTL